MKALALPILATAALTGALVLDAQAAQECSASKAKTAAYTGGKTIVETAIGAGQFETLVAAVKHAGLVETLNGKGKFTVFAPTDAAFASLPKGTLENLLKPENRDLLTSILTYHVVPGAVTAADVVKLDFVATANGQRIDITVEEGTVMIDGATVVATDIHCSNGVIHVIDAVILPETKNIVQTAVAAGSFNTLAAALQAGQLVGALEGPGPFTVFAPTDDAFAKLPEATLADLLKPENRATLQSILKYHVVQGRVYADQAIEAGHAKTLAGGEIKISHRDEQVFINGSRVLSADIETSNGVIHVVDTVLLPN